MGRCDIRPRCCCCTWTVCNIGVAIVGALLPVLRHPERLGSGGSSVSSGISWAQSRPSPPPPHLCPNASLSALVRDASLRGLVTSMMQPPHDRTPSPHVRAQQKQQLEREYQPANQPVRRVPIARALTRATHLPSRGKTTTGVRW